MAAGHGALPLGVVQALQQGVRGLGELVVVVPGGALLGVDQAARLTEEKSP